MTEATVLRRSLLLRTVEGEALLNLAQKIEVGATMTYEMVRSELSVDLQAGAGRNLWRAVQKTLATEHKMQFACVHRVGYVRLDDDGKVDKSARYIGQAAKRVRSAGRVLVTADRGKMSESKKLAFDVQNAVIGALQTSIKPAMMVSRSTPVPKDELEKLMESVRRLS